MVNILAAAVSVLEALNTRNASSHTDCISSIYGHILALGAANLIAILIAHAAPYTYIRKY